MSTAALRLVAHAAQDWCVECTALGYHVDFYAHLASRLTGRAYQCIPAADRYITKVAVLRLMYGQPEVPK